MMTANSKSRTQFSNMDTVTLILQKFTEMKLQLVKLFKSVLQQELREKIFTSQPSCGTTTRTMLKEQSKVVSKD